MCSNSKLASRVAFDRYDRYGKCSICPLHSISEPTRQKRTPPDEATTLRQLKSQNTGPPDEVTEPPDSIDQFDILFDSIDTGPTRRGGPPCGDQDRKLLRYPYQRVLSQGPHNTLMQKQNGMTSIWNSKIGRRLSHVLALWTQQCYFPSIMQPVHVAFGMETVCVSLH